MQRFQTFDGINLAYRDEGAGLPVLCLAGLTRNGSDFDYVAPFLRDVRLIRLDYRGRGASDWADPMSYTLPDEARDALALLDHLGIDRAAILGTSRGGMIAMTLAATAHDRLLGVCMNDIGPEVGAAGLELIRGYLGKNPVVRTHAEAARARARMMTGFANVPDSRWLEEVQRHFIKTAQGLKINYDPDLAKIFERAEANPAPVDFWPFYDALAGLPLAVIRGANSDLLTRETAQQMRQRRPDMIFAEVPDRGHVPFLDEAGSVAALRAWLEKMP